MQTRRATLLLLTLLTLGQAPWRTTMADKLFLMPLDWEALLTDEKVIAMTDQAFRAYMHLLRAAWQSDIPASLPDNDSFLARVTGLGLETWKQVRPEIEVCFRALHGRWHQKKMRQVYDEVVQRRKIQSEKGKNGAAKRWANGTGIAQAMPGHCPPHSNQSQNETEKDNQTERHQASPSSSSPSASSDGLGLPGIDPGLNRNDPVPFGEVVTAFNDLCVSLPRVRLNDARKHAIRARWLECKKAGEDPIVWFRGLFSKAEASDFLSGRKPAPQSRWRCGFDWLIGPKNAPKVMEGNYDNQERNGTDLTTPGASWR
jgi:uncharacterized protein YdaU (DUF1376 family)